MYIGFKVLPANPPAVARAQNLPRVPEPVLLVEGTVGCKPYVARVVGPDPIYGVKRVFLGRKTVVGDPSQYAEPGKGLRVQVIVSLAGLNPLEILELRGGMMGDDVNAAGESVKGFFEYRRTVVDDRWVDDRWVSVLRAIKLRGFPNDTPSYVYESSNRDWFQLRQRPIRRDGDPPEGRVLRIVKLQGSESQTLVTPADATQMLMEETLRSPEAMRRQTETIRRQAAIIARLTDEAARRQAGLAPVEPEEDDDTPGKRIIDMAE